MIWPDDFMNKVICGDCRSVLTGIPDGSVDLVVTSPPYNCRKDYGVSDDQQSWSDYYAFMEMIIDELYRVLVIGGTVCIVVPFAVRWQREHRFKDSWEDYDASYRTHRGKEIVYGKGRCEFVGQRILGIMHSKDTHLREPITWVKSSGGIAVASNNKMGCDSDPYLRSVSEMILLGSKGRWFHRGGTGRRGKKAVPYTEYTKDVWFIQPVSSKQHPAVFPLEIPERLCRLFIHAPDAIVLDPFAGIGTTCLAAIRHQVRFIGIELNSEYATLAEKHIAEAKEEKAEADRQLDMFDIGFVILEGDNGDGRNSEKGLYRNMLFGSVRRY